MNCGLANLDRLKKHLLASSLAGEKRFDAVIQDIGLGVAAMMEQYCNRNFERLENDTAVFQADRASFMLPRYPVEAITAVELKLKDADDFVAQDLSFIQSTSKESGLVYLPEVPDAGPYWAEVRFTFTGGYWFETLEPEDATYPSACPAGAKQLPADLRLAWLIQCREVWSRMDKLGTGLVDEPGKQSGTDVLDLSPMTKRTLANYVQMQPI